MAVVSPALVLAMSAMFVLTKMAHHVYLSERVFLFGLRYCVQPTPQQLAAIAAATLPAAPAAAAKKRGRRASVARAEPQKTRVTAASLPVMRAILGPVFFREDAALPHHKEFSNLFCMLVGYLTAFLLEQIVVLFRPPFARSNTWLIAMFAVALATGDAIRLSVAMSSGLLVGCVGAVMGFAALAVITGGDYTGFVRFDDAFDALRGMVRDGLVDKFDVGELAAAAWAARAALAARVSTAAVAGAVSAAAVVPARRFSQFDLELHRQYTRDDSVDREDPYALPRPTPLVIFGVAVDYVLSFVVLAYWCADARNGSSRYSLMRITSLLACVVVRFATCRPRLQAYLDGAVDAYRSFWADKSLLGVVDAGERLKFQVLGASYFLMMMGMAYISSPVIALLFALCAKNDGGLGMPSQMRFALHESTRSQVFSREVFGFLSWWAIASYFFFAGCSVMVEVMSDFIDPRDRDFGRKAPPSANSSDRRRRRREMRKARGSEN